MGVFSYFTSLIFKDNKTISEKLEEIEDDILNLDEKRQSNLDLEKRIIASLVFYSIVFYILGSAILILYYYPSSTWSQCFLLLLPLIIFPFGIFGLKKLFHSYFLERVDQMDRDLKALHKKKRKLLDDVMEKETYKRAKEILSRYDPLRFNQLDSRHKISSSRPLSSESELSRRLAAHASTSVKPISPQIAAPQSLPSSNTSRSQTNFIRPAANMGPAQFQMRTPLPGVLSQLAVPRLPRPILPRERSVVDRMFDALVGDGPDKRYALICMRCASHNGMSLAEEFPFLSFRCCYCGFVNPPRRQRTMAPIVPYIDNSSSCPPTPDTVSEAGENEAENVAKMDDKNDPEESINSPPTEQKESVIDQSSDRVIDDCSTSPAQETNSIDETQGTES